MSQNAKLPTGPHVQVLPSYHSPIPEGLRRTGRRGRQGKRQLAGVRLPERRPLQRAALRAAASTPAPVADAAVAALAAQNDRFEDICKRMEVVIRLAECLFDAPAEPWYWVSRKGVVSKVTTAELQAIVESHPAVRVMGCDKEGGWLSAAEFGFTPTVAPEEADAPYLNAPR